MPTRVRKTSFAKRVELASIGKGKGELLQMPDIRNAPLSAAFFNLCSTAVTVDHFHFLFFCMVFLRASRCDLLSSVTSMVMCDFLALIG